jgi:hypothetical protein
VYGLGLLFSGEGWNQTERDWRRLNCDQSLSTEIRQKLHALDRSVFGADRTLLLDALIADSVVTPKVAMTAGGRLQGYALARRGVAASYIGPIIAQDE